MRSCIFSRHGLAPYAGRHVTFYTSPKKRVGNRIEAGIVRELSDGDRVVRVEHDDFGGKGQFYTFQFVKGLLPWGCSGWCLEGHLYDCRYALRSQSSFALSVNLPNREIKAEALRVLSGEETVPPIDRFALCNVHGSSERAESEVVVERVSENAKRVWVSYHKDDGDIICLEFTRRVAAYYGSSTHGETYYVLKGREYNNFALWWKSK